MCEIAGIVVLFSQRDSIAMGHSLEGRFPSLHHPDDMRVFKQATT